MRTRFNFSRLIRNWNQLLPAGMIACVLCSAAFAQSNDFNSGSDGSDGALTILGSLAPVEDFTAVYDAARGEIVTFGGRQFSPYVGIDLDHTYTFDGVKWERKRPEVSPPAREEPVMAYDSARQQVVLYSGDSSENDCWLWDGTSWTEVSPPNPDLAFYIFDMAFDDARDETLLVTRPVFNGPEMETWSFDGASWTQKAPATPLTVGNGVALSYDPTLQKVVALVFINPSTFETWTWDGTDWTQVVTDPVDIDLFYGSLLFDGRTNSTIFLDSEGGHTFTGTNWIPFNNVPEFFIYGLEQVVYHAGLNALVRMNGGYLHESGGTQNRNETWAWNADGTTERLASGFYTYDMSGRPDGIWNYTTIDIGPNAIVDFINNEANTPLRWLASGDMNIEGTLDLSGKERVEPGLFPYEKGLAGIPGPGGYEGAVSSPLGTLLRVPGGGPGGGLYTGATNSSRGSFTNYGNPWLYPLTGGSGAGAGGSTGGAGGGGAVLIASSETINIQGQVLAEGQYAYQAEGAGGGVLLRADTIIGDGTIAAARIRLEAWDRQLDELTINISPFNQYTQGPPLLPNELGNNAPTLWVDSINGVSVANPRLSSESQLEADAYLPSSGGTSTIIVKGTNIPDQAEIFLKISLQDQTILEPPVVIFSGGQASITVDLPEGFGAIRATAKFPFSL